MPLHPEIVAHLAARAALGRPPLPGTPVPVARADAEADARERPPGPQVAEVRAAAFAGPAGPVPVRIYRPDRRGRLPALVFLHGGGFVLCSLDTHDALCRALAAGAGAVVIAVDYRLAPEHPFPAACDDALAAVRWAAAAAGELGIDAGRIAVGGDSAGGNLAAVTAIRLRDEGGPRLAGQLLLYPVVDHADAGQRSYVTYAEGFGLTAEGMRWFFDHYVPDAGARAHPHVAPLRAGNLSGLPPAHVMTAEHDVLRDEGIAYAARLRTAGVPVDACHFADLNHGCLNQLVGSAAVAPAHRAAVAWLRRIFGEA